MDLQLFQLEITLEDERLDKEAEQQRLKALELQENIISLAGSMSRIFHRRSMKKLEEEKKKKSE